jgi:hypothetical protein
MRGDLERDLFLLAYPAVADRFAIQGSANANGVPVLEARGPSGRTFIVMLSSDPGLPQTVSYEGSHPMTGARAQFLERFEDYRVVDGVLRPYRITTTIDGEPFAEALVTSITLNADVAPSAFQKPSGS